MANTAREPRSSDVTLAIRAAAWAVDAVLVASLSIFALELFGVPLLAPSLWLTARLLAAVTGRSVGRLVFGWRLTTLDGRRPSSRGVAHMILVSTPLLATAATVVLVAGRAGSSTSWAAGIAAVIATLSAPMCWTSGPSKRPAADEACGVFAVGRTSGVQRCG